MAQRAPQHARPSATARLGGVEGNARLTSATGAVLFALLFFEGLTILQVGSLLSAHVFIGFVLIPPVLLKVVTTTWRFIQYYRGDDAYQQKGPPLALLRLLGPLVIVFTFAVFATGVALIVGAPTSWRPRLLQLHQVTFLLWFAVTAVHVLGHLAETATLAPRDWARRTRRQVDGASLRQWLSAASIAVGLVVALWLTPYAAGWTTV